MQTELIKPSRLKSLNAAKKRKKRVTPNHQMVAYRKWLDQLKAGSLESNS